MVKVDSEKLKEGIAKLDLILMGKEHRNKSVSKEALEEVIRVV